MGMGLGMWVQTCGGARAWAWVWACGYRRAGGAGHGRVAGHVGIAGGVGDGHGPGRVGTGVRGGVGMGVGLGMWIQSCGGACALGCVRVFMHDKAIAFLSS